MYISLCYSVHTLYTTLSTPQVKYLYSTEKDTIMKATLHIFLSSFIVIVGILTFVEQVSAHTVASTPQISLFQVFNGNFASDKDFQQTAPKVQFVWGASTDTISVWKHYNPTIRLAYYVPFNRDPQAHTLSWWQTNHPGWVEYRCDRHTPAYKGNEPNMPLDISNPAVRSWQIQTLILPASQLGYAAIGWDNLDPNWYGACGHYQQGKWVQSYSGATNDSNWHKDVINWLVAQLQQLHTLKTPLLSIPNVDFRGWALQGLSTLKQITDATDAIFEEQGFVGSNRILSPTWNTLKDWIAYTQQQGKMFYSCNGLPHNPQPADLEWIVANYFLLNQGHLSLWISRDQAYGSPAGIYPEYNAVSLLQHSLGLLYISQHLERHDYSGGLVLVDADAVSHVFLVPGRKKDVYGHPVSGHITIQSGAGIILLNA